MSLLSKKKWLELEEKKNLSGKEALRAVREKGSTLRYVKEQTREMCLEAVKQNGHALQFVKEQTREICLEAVRQNGWALQYVEERFLDQDTCDGKIVEIDGKKYKLTEVLK